jgi:hypothetical protein
MEKMMAAMKRAAEKAKQTGHPYCVVEMDQDEGRRICIVPESYTEGDEFEAFEGSILWHSAE